MKSYKMEWMDHKLELGAKTTVMGILNVTPDSFSDGGKFFSLSEAASQGIRMARDGADIIDIGGESTRPFSEPVTIEEEINRVIPVIERLAGEIDIPISIDTNKAAVAEAALKAGASIINDISALRFDPEMAPLVARADVPVILMHMKGTPGNMQVSPTYDNLMGEIQRFFERAIESACKKGIKLSRMIIDPGIGFGKTIRHNLTILRKLSVLESLDVPILVGSSRKMFIRKTLSENSEGELSPDSKEVETGSQATVAAAVLNGAHMVRVHDVANTRQTVKIIDAIRKA